MISGVSEASADLQSATIPAQIHFSVITRIGAGIRWSGLMPGGVTGGEPTQDRLIVWGGGSA